MVILPDFDMRHHTVLVTGAAGLLGKYHCEALLELGANVIATDLSLDDFSDLQNSEIVHASRDLICFEELDVTDYSKITLLAEKLEASNQSPTTLLNNAALNPMVGTSGLSVSGRLEDFDEQFFLKEISVGLTGAINCCKVFGEIMAKNNFGNIVNIASDLAVIAPYQSLYQDKDEASQKSNKKPVSYSAIKHAIVGLTKYMATYYHASNVRCNALSPGGVKTDQSLDFVEELQKLIPLGRMAHPSEYKGAIKFLCSDASAYMNGQNLVMDGGRSIW